MGRTTWLAPEVNSKPFPGCVTVVLSKTLRYDFTYCKFLVLKSCLDGFCMYSSVPDRVLLCNNFNRAIEHLISPEYRDTIENIWIVGGRIVYEV